MVKGRIDPKDCVSSFVSGFVDVQGHRLHYLDEGKGSPLVMLHGNPTWSYYFRRLITAFSGRYRTIVPDHIGCGLSAKPSDAIYPYTLERRVSDLETLLSSLGLTEKITLVLHDWGGMIGMTYAVRHPEQIRQIILLNTTAFFPPHGKKIPFRLRLIRNFPLLSRAAVLGGNLFARSALYMAARKPLPKEVKKCLIAPYDSWKNRIATFKFVMDIPLRPSDAGFDLISEVSDGIHRFQELPMLILWGRHDFVFDLDYFEEWKRRFPRAEAHLIDGAGHYVLEDAPEEVVRFMEAFLKKTEDIPRKEDAHA